MNSFAPANNNLHRKLTVPIVLGVVSLALGAAVLTSPGLTLLIVALLFGLQLILTGFARIVLGTALTGGRRRIVVILGALTIIAGIVCLLHPGTSLLVIVWSVAFGWLTDGLSELAASTEAKQPALRRATSVVFGISSVVGAVLITTFPGTSLLLFTQTGGVLLIIFAVITLTTTLRSRHPATASV